MCYLSTPLPVCLLQAAAPAAAAAAAPQQEEPKWRVRSKPGDPALKGFADEAYAEFFPSMMDMGVADDERDGQGAKAAAAAAGGGKGGGGRGPVVVVVQAAAWMTWRRSCRGS